MKRLMPATILATITVGLLGASAPSGSAADVRPHKVHVRAEPPSALVERFEQSDGLFAIQHPSNWRAYETADGVTFAPEGGVKELPGGARALLYGLVVGQYDTGGAVDYAAASLVGEVLATHPYLKPRGGLSRPQETEDGSALTMTLSGPSAVTGEEEWVSISVRRLHDGRIVYAFGIVPGPEYDEAAGAFAQMVRSLSSTDDLIRHAARTADGR
ncbi:MAG: hypothetical protein ABW221_09555 [Vicinamibacteria bacterium]